MDGYVCMCIPYTYKFHTIHERSESVLSQTSSEGVKWAKEGKRDGKWKRRKEGGERERGGSPIELWKPIKTTAPIEIVARHEQWHETISEKWPKKQAKLRLAISQAKTKPTKLQSPITSCGKEKEASNPQSNATESRALAIIIASRMDGWAEEWRRDTMDVDMRMRRRRWWTGVETIAGSVVASRRGGRLLVAFCSSLTLFCRRTWI